MPQKVGDLIGGHKPLATVRINDSVRDAVKVMHENGYAQVPVVDERGRVEGIFSEHALTKAVYLGIAPDILEAPLRGFTEKPGKVVSQSESIFQVARLLSHQRAVVIGDNGVAIGIVTDHDIAQYLAKWSEGIGLVEDIEQRLRGYIERVFWTPNMLDAALLRAFGSSRDHEGRPAKEYKELTLGDHIGLIVAKENWPQFEPYFKPKSVFNGLLGKARGYRNRIVHLRQPLTPAELETLNTARDWIVRCPKVPEHKQDTAAEEHPAN